MSETAELLSDWKAVYGEIFPHRNPEAMRVDDALLALGVLLRREVRMGPASTGTVSNLRTRTLDRLAKHNAKDPE